MGQNDFRRSWQARTISVLCSATMVFGLTPLTAIAQPADPSGGGSQSVAGQDLAAAAGADEGLAAQGAQPAQEEGAGQAATPSDGEQVAAGTTPASDGGSATDQADASDAAITTTSLPAARVGRAYSAKVASSIQGATFAAEGLPDGLAMAEDGTISGTPTAASDGTNVTVTATADGTTATAQLTLKVRAAVAEVDASWSWNRGSTAGVSKVSNAATATRGRIASTIYGPPMPPRWQPSSLSVTSIGDGAFSGCAKLRTLVIPSSVTTIADNAFEGCDQLAIQCDEGSAADTFAKAHGIPVRYADLDDATAEVSDLVFELPELAQIDDADRPAIEEARAAYDALTAEQKSQINAGTHLAACEAALASCDKDPVITTESLEDGIWGDSYSAQLAFTGPYAVTWGLAEGSELPAGLSLDAATGVISGRAPEPGTYTFTVTATSAAGKVGTKECTLTSDHPAAEAAELTFTVADGAATVSGVTNENTATSAQIPATYESEGVTYPVTAIGEGAFWSCARLESVSIPEGVVSIGRDAFREDPHLQRADLPDTVTSIGERAFSSSGVRQATIPASVKSIGKEAFYATDLESLVIPEGVESVGDAAFRSCEHLKSVSLPSTLDLLRERDVSSRDGYVTYVTDGNYMFQGCTSLEDVTFAEGFGQAISHSMFQDCDSLKTVTIPGTVKAVGFYAFRGCDSLESVVIEDGVEGIDDGAFSYCPVLKTVSIPSSVTVIHGASGASGGMGFIISSSPNAVILCAAGTEAENHAILNNLPYQLVESPRIDAAPVYSVSDGTATITGTSNSRNFTVAELSATTSDGTPVKAIGARAFYWERMLTRASVPAGVESVGRQAFANCTHLTQVSLPSTLSSLGWAAFSGDTRLTEVSFAPVSTLAAIEPYTFYNCSALEQVTLPEGVTSIGKDAFAGDAALKVVSIPDSVTEIADDAFVDCPNVAIRCSEGSAAEKFAQEHGIAIYTPVVSRIGGATAADTASSIAARAFAGATADTVVVARDDDYHDALAGSGLAGALGAPILLTDSGSLSQAAADEAKALGATHAVILGGESAVSPRVAGQLEGLGLSVDRVAGDDVYGTSMAITRALVATGQASSEYAIAVNPTTFADAVSISGWAYANKVPVVLQTWGDTSAERGYDDEAKSILEGREVIACGGTGAVSDESLAGLSVTRLGGDTIYDTSRAIAEWELEHGMSASDVTVASAIPDYSGVDALAASALAGRAGGVTLLAQANPSFGWHDGGEAALGFIGEHASDIQRVHVLGGEAASPEAFYTSVQAIFGED